MEMDRISNFRNGDRFRIRMMHGIEKRRLEKKQWMHPKRSASIAKFIVPFYFPKGR